MKAALLHNIQLLCRTLFFVCLSIQSSSQITSSDGLPIMHGFKREKGTYVTSRWDGSNSWHEILHHVHHLCSSWQGGQAMWWLLRDSLVQ